MLNRLGLGRVYAAEIIERDLEKQKTSSDQSQAEYSKDHQIELAQF